ncbi:MAG TPA: RluA family pseudouridine synthase [Acidimicrobiia bacterium]|nr:RluA family pseudouridine synthase [Acidimicrobiia bacterium]
MSGSEGAEPLVVPEALAGERVDRVVALLTGWSRAEVQALVEADGVLVGGGAVGKSRRLRAGEVVEIVATPPEARPPEAEDVPLTVRYEDEDVVVVAKPAGLVVHPGAAHAHGTMVHGLLARYPGIAAVGDPARPGIVHRLDRDTSGLMVVARSPAAYDALVAALAARTVDRRYVALVWGRPEAERGVVDAPIGRSVRRPTRMAVRESGRSARTAYVAVRAYDDPTVTLLECRLETGRTHQIRVHLQAIGHPVVGDAAYGGRRPQLALDRPFLHAAHLAFTHPGTGAQLAFDEPLPEDLQRVLNALDG